MEESFRRGKKKPKRQISMPHVTYGALESQAPLYAHESPLLRIHIVCSCVTALRAPPRVKNKVSSQHELLGLLARIFYAFPALLFGPNRFPPKPVTTLTNRRL